jgi:hypothetical protein
LFLSGKFIANFTRGQEVKRKAMDQWQELQFPPEHPEHEEPALVTVRPPSPLERKAKADIFFSSSLLVQWGHAGVSPPITRSSNSLPQAWQTKSNKGISYPLLVQFSRPNNLTCKN